MIVEVVGIRELRFDDGAPVRAASAIAPLGDGWLVAQDDATHAAWLRPAGSERVRIFSPVEGLDLFSEAEGTKHLKPDLEAACPLPAAGDGPAAVLLLGSGSHPARMRGALVSVGADGGPRALVGDLRGLYLAAARALGISPDEVNIEGVCCVGERLHWFNRGNLMAGVPNASVEVSRDQLVAALAGRLDPATVEVGTVRHYDLGQVGGVGLAITDALALPDGRVLVSAAAEDTPNAYDDGPVVGAALAVLADGKVEAVAILAELASGPIKVEGLALARADEAGAGIVAVVDGDDPTVASLLVELNVSW